MEKPNDEFVFYFFFVQVINLKPTCLAINISTISLPESRDTEIK